MPQSDQVPSSGATRWTPDDDVVSMFDEIRRLVRQHPTVLGRMPKALDRLYSVEAIRRREAIRLRRWRRACRRNPKLTKPPTRECSRPLKWAREPVRDKDGKRKLGPRERPWALTLAGRYQQAWRDTFAPERFDDHFGQWQPLPGPVSLQVLTAPRRLRHARWRLLLVWLLVEPDRGTVLRPHLTEFQASQNRRPDDASGLPGGMPMWLADGVRAGDKLFVAPDGLQKMDRESASDGKDAVPRWVTATREALKELLEQEAHAERQQRAGQHAVPADPVESIVPPAESVEAESGPSGDGNGPEVKPAEPKAKQQKADAMSAEDRALGIFAKDQSLSVTEIADRAGCSRQYLYQCSRFKQARRIYQRSARESRPRGSKDTDGEIEAWRAE